MYRLQHLHDSVSQSARSHIRRNGRRLGRSGGYYDLFPKKYQSLAKEMIWKPPLHGNACFSQLSNSIP
ncbi:hypothetical protein LINGRAHAP2_LOCUS34940 [Linum grandiflorum]